jgi:hypothetical protein
MTGEQKTPPITLSPRWRSRLRRVAAACFTSPHDFAREAIQAEIVRREMLLEQQGGCDPEWRTLVTLSPSSTRLH